MPAVSIEIDPQEVLRLQGYRRPSDVPTPQVLEILKAAMAEGPEILQPRWIYQEFPVNTMDAAGCRLEDGSEVLIQHMPDRWGGVTALGLAVCTVGAAIEDRIESLFKEGEFPLAFMLDSLGSVATECLAEGLHRQVCTERLAQGLKVSPRVSPGYPRWAIEEQRKIFALLPADTIGVHLNPYAIMTPRKSISFAVGIGLEVHMGTGSSPCQSCDMRGCAYRRAPRRQGHPSPWVAEVAPLVLSSQAEPRR